MYTVSMLRASPSGSLRVYVPIIRFSRTVIIFFFNDTATTEIYTLSLHDALPISGPIARGAGFLRGRTRVVLHEREVDRSEEHTSELQSHSDLVCRLLLEKKKRGALASPLPELARQRVLGCCHRHVFLFFQRLSAR